MIERDIKEHITKISKQFPAIIIQGPRQSGKTTLAKTVFQNKPYYNFETPAVRDLFEGDPIAFLKNIGDNGAIFDEAQNVPSLFSYLQEIIDNDRTNGKFIITGSSNFNLSQKVSQSLAGRCIITKLLPLSVSEIRKSNNENHKVDITELILNGGYPAIYSQDVDSTLYYQSYIETYVEKDIRRTLNIKDWRVFNTFLKSLASRIGSILEITSISNDCGINTKTTKEWLSILEQSYIIFTLPAWYKNIGKRLVKSPKIYFYDTGIATRLLGLTTKEQIDRDRLKGGLFENLVILEKIKTNLNSLASNDYYYYRTSNGKEVDLIESCDNHLNAYEIKYSQTFTTDFVNGLLFFKNDYPETQKASVIYNGEPIPSFKGCEVQKF